MAADMDRIGERRASTDTRTIQRGDVFFALSGKNFDGHDFIGQALERGATAFVASDPGKVRAEWSKAAEAILVPDVLAAYGELAKARRARYSIPVIGITGSSGKTTVKELIAHLLGAERRVLKNQGTENNLVGVPKTLLKMDAQHEAAVIEMGTNAKGEIDRLSSLAEPTIGVLTRIGYGHLEGLGDLKGVYEEKTSLLRHIRPGGMLVVNGEDPMLAGLHDERLRVRAVGCSPRKSACFASDIRQHARGTSFRVNGSHEMESPLLGRHNVLNALIAIEVARELSLDWTVIREALASFRNAPGRLDLKVLDGRIIIDDTYNANPTSFEAALATLRDLGAEGRKAVVCADMLELGDTARALHEECGRRVAALGPALLVATGMQCAFLAESAIAEGLPETSVRLARDSEEAGRIVREWSRPGDVILVKGSRGMRMERVFDCFTSCSTR